MALRDSIDAFINTAVSGKLRGNMSNEEPNVHSMNADIRLLQQGQQHIQSAVTNMSNKLDGVVDALTTLVRLTEKHDALSHRVQSIEKRNDEADKTVSRGNNFMFAAVVVGPIALAVLGWLTVYTLGIGEKVAKHAEHYEAHR